MKTLKLLLPALLLTGPAALSNSALAASDDEEMGAEDSGRARGQDKPVREIVKGFYARANVGGAFFLGNLNGFVSPGTYSSLGLGQDFVDSEKMSLAWEIAFSQGVHNGCYFEDQAIGGCSGNLKGKASPYIQGDVRTYAVGASLEASVYPTRRLGVGLNLGGGVMFAPLLMVEQYYLEDVVRDSWGLAAPPAYHTGPHPQVQVGPTFEYYTKLSHFSVGFDANVTYALQFDLGANATGYMKYTF